jgi:exonuclease III
MTKWKHISRESEMLQRARRMGSLYYGKRKRAILAFGALLNLACESPISLTQSLSPLIFIVRCGDLNVAPLDADLSHADHYKKQVASYKARRPDAAHIGQPGCTPAERAQFARILAAGNAIDLYRMLHPPDSAVCTTDASQPLFSWRGGDGKHYGRGMRIDHFVGSQSFAERVEDARILGTGAERNGFLGSDHCPVILKIKASNCSASASADVEKHDVE